VNEIQQLYFGYGYLIGSLITMILWIVILYIKHDDLEYRIKKDL